LEGRIVGSSSCASVGQRVPSTMAADGKNNPPRALTSHSDVGGVDRATGRHDSFQLTTTNEPFEFPRSDDPPNLVGCAGCGGGWMPA
jgi:hypothetical protein